ncbi:hypothetical protein LIA77_03322 [Sarocladium implicatum]|nr:hypothetical protein LIA77_03322 [Sarocladium implicatum]
MPVSPMTSRDSDQADCSPSRPQDSNDQAPDDGSLRRSMVVIRGRSHCGILNWNSNRRRPSKEGGPGKSCDELSLEKVDCFNDRRGVQPLPPSSTTDRRFSAQDIRGRFGRWCHKNNLHSRLSKVVLNCQESWLVDLRTNRRNAGDSVVREVGRGAPHKGGWRADAHDTACTKIAKYLVQSANAPQYCNQRLKGR